VLLDDGGDQAGVVPLESGGDREVENFGHLRILPRHGPTAV